MAYQQPVAKDYNQCRTQPHVQLLELGDANILLQSCRSWALASCPSTNWTQARMPCASVVGWTNIGVYSSSRQPLLYAGLPVTFPAVQRHRRSPVSRYQFILLSEQQHVWKI